MFTKTLTKTLGKVASFVRDLEEGITLSTAANAELDAQAAVIQEQAAVNTAEIELAERMIAKLS